MRAPMGAWEQTPRRTDSPMENPYGGAPRGYMSEKGAPKKEPQDRSSSFVNLFNGNVAQQYSASDLEEQNDARLSGLSERIKLLKDISTGIGVEARDSTNDMNSLNEIFANTGAFLGSTFQRMNSMARRQRGWFCNMMLFLVLVVWIFVSLWWWRR